MQIALATSSKPTVDPNSSADMVADRDLVTVGKLPDGDSNVGSIQDAVRAAPRRALFPESDDEDK